MPAPRRPDRRPGPASAAVTRLSLHPRTFKARKGTKVRFTLSAPAPVKLSAGRVSMTVAGRAGVNTVRFKKRLKPGRYRLRVSAGTTATAKFRVER